MDQVLLPYGFLLEDNKNLKGTEMVTVLLPYGFLLEDNFFSSLHTQPQSFATIWIFARR